MHHTHGRVAALLTAGTLTATVALAGTAAAAPNPAAPVPGSADARTAHSAPGVPGLPSGAPPAATAPLPTLPAPSRAAWPFPNDWSQTEGTGHYAGGAYFFTDFVYDDHGPATGGQGSSTSGLAPDHGSFTYPTGAGYDGGNADMFGAAVGDDGTSSYWRVDWASMPDPTIPIAEWTISVPGATPTASTWPANAGVATARGFNDALVVTSAGAQLLGPTGAVLRSFPVTVDRSSYSFIVTVPHTALAVPTSGQWGVELASGLDATPGLVPTTGSLAFATVPTADGGQQGGGANVYNVTFRTAGVDERQLVCPGYPFDQHLAETLVQGLATAGSTQPGVPTVACANNWMENDQANTLRTQVQGTPPDVGKYTASIDWSTVADRATPTVPVQAGYFNRWYVTPLYGTAGITGGTRPPDSSTYTGPTYLDRVQVYAVDIPRSYADRVNSGHATPTPLTWILHSLGANLNQYGGTDPTQVVQECADRGNICATTEGLSEGQWYYGEAEVDFFDVWHALASSYDLDPDATTISGYSMGGWASYKLAEEYPNLFAQAMSLEGPVICGDEQAPSTASTPYVGTGSASGGTYTGYRSGAQCAADADSAAAAPGSVQRSGVPNPAAMAPPAYDPLGALDNLRWVPYAMTCGAIDQLVTVTGCQTQASRLAADGVQLFEAAYPAEDHLAFATQNDFTPTDTALGAAPRYRAIDPGQFTYTWYPDLASGPSGVDGIGPAGQVGPTGAYWLSGLAGRTVTPGSTSAVVASSAALPDPAVTYVDSQAVDPGLNPTPNLELRQAWQLGVTPAPQQSVSLQLGNVATATLDAAGAGLACGTVGATTDGPTRLTVTHLQPSSPVTSAGTAVATADGTGAAVVPLAAGTTALALCGAAVVAGPVAATPEAPLAVGVPLAAAATAYGVTRLRRRRAA